MAHYKLTESGVHDTENNLHIPNDPGNRHYQEFIEWKNAGGVPEALPQPTIAEIHSAQLRVINAGCEGFISSIREGYPQSEVMSWSKQEEEARAYLADSTAAAPLLRGLAAARGIDLTLLVQKVVEKADAYTTAIGAAIGRRQALETQLLATVTEADAKAIVW